MEFTKLLNQLSSSSSTSNSMPVQAKPNLSQLNSEIVQREQHIPHTNPRQVLGLKIFYTCDKCLEGCISPVPVFCPDNEAGNDDIVHCCKPERVLTIKNILSDLRRSFEYSQIKNNSFQCLKDFVSARNYEYLISIPLSNPVPEVLLLNNPDKPDIPIRIWYSKESCVELNLDKLRNDNYDYTNNHWAVRAIAQKLVRLTNNEASQFLETVGTATYGFFKIRLNRSVYNLFLILNDILGARRILLYNC